MSGGVGARGDDSKLFVLDLIGDKLKGVDPKSVKGVLEADVEKLHILITRHAMVRSQ